MRLWYFSSSVNSFFNGHAQPSSIASYLIFGRTFCLLPYFMCANSEGSEPSLSAYVVSTIISWAGSFDVWTSCFGILSQHDLRIKEWMGMGFGDSLMSVEDREGWNGIVATSSVVPRRPPRLRDWDEMRWWPDIWSQNKCRSLWPIFHGPLSLLCILKS